LRSCKKAEITYFASISQNPDDDYDGDGLTNHQEYQTGADMNIMRKKPRRLNR
jgi:hypothetical protein